MTRIRILSLVFIFSICSIAFLYAADETLTITTYYPSPYGVYRELRSQRMAIGDNYINGSAYCWEGSCTTTINADADLVVQGNVGIGTTEPKNKLDVEGGLAVGAGYSGTSTAPANGAIIEGKVGIGTNSPGAYQLYVAGNAYTTGIWDASDERMKKNVKKLSDVLERLMFVDGVTFDWRIEEFPQENLSKGRQVGIIAQNLEKVFPELVNTGASGYKSVAYDKLAAVLLEAIKEQQKEIEALRTEIQSLKKPVRIES
jgi:hypothetical protein